MDLTNWFYEMEAGGRISYEKNCSVRSLKWLNAYFT